MQLARRLANRATWRGGILIAALMAFAAPVRAQSDIVLHPASASARTGKWSIVSDSSAAGGKAIRHANANASKVSTALASPANYFELTFTASAGIPYRLWMHGKADSNYWGNDSVFVQFSGSVSSTGSSKYRIGTSSATEMNLEECSGCGLSGWKWQDNGWGRGVLGPTVYFATSGTQKLRVQTREDGLSLDQIILSPAKYLSSAPASTTSSTSASSTTATDIVLNPASPSARAGKWSVASDSGAIGDRAIRHPNGGAGKLSAPLASPSNYFELTFTAVAGTPYRLWLHGRADDNYWGNDSVFVQFSGSVTSSGSSKYRIGTTSATEVNLEDCSGCGLNGWKWQDNGWGRGVLGSPIYFATTGTQKIRIQTREDGLSIDQVILSPSRYMSSAPAATGSSSSSTTTTAPATADPAPSSSTGTLLKVLDWNTHHGIGTDGRYSISRFVTWIVKSGANVVSLNEVEKYVGSYGNENQPARYASLLKSATGKTWYYKFAQRDGGTNGQGNLILSTFPLEDTDGYELSYSRSVARAQILVNGIRVNVFSTHLDADSSSRRATQMKQLISWSSSFAQQHIYAGDFNAWPGAAEISNMTNVAYDAWAEAKADGTAVAYSGNTAGNTRNSRIDYVFYSKKATRLHLKGARVFDTRDGNGVMPSDHRPVMATFEVK